MNEDNVPPVIDREYGNETPNIIIPKKNVIMDSQILSTLMSCPRMTDFRFNLHLQSTGGKSVSMEMGSIVHKFMEVYYRSQVNGIKKSECEGFAYTAALQYSQSPEVVNCAPEDIEWALTTCHQYLEFYNNDFWIPLETEVVKGEVLYEDDEIRILWKAKFDLIADTNQGIYPIDHKTMKQRRDTVSLNNQFMGQCVLMKTRLMFVNKIGFQKSLKPAERFTRAPVNYTFDRLMEWQSVILPYYAKLMLMYSESEYWPPNFTHCENKYGFCQFKSVCETDRNMREETLGNEFVVGEQWNPQTEE
jgi:hypothetical protein